MAYPITIDPKTAIAVLGTVLEGSDVRIMQDTGSGTIIVLGRKEDHELVRETLAALANGALKQPVSGKGALVFEGQNFEHWLKIAKTDQSVRAMADAIQACSAIAKTDAQRAVLSEIIDSSARRHGTWVQSIDVESVANPTTNM